MSAGTLFQLECFHSFWAPRNCRVEGKTLLPVKLNKPQLFFDPHRLFPRHAAISRRAVELNAVHRELDSVVACQCSSSQLIHLVCHGLLNFTAW